MYHPKVQLRIEVKIVIIVIIIKNEQMSRQLETNQKHFIWEDK